MPWHRFMDEIAEAGYGWTELGPYGYLPTDINQLKQELADRGLRVSGTFIMGDLAAPTAWGEILFDTNIVRLLNRQHITKRVVGDVGHRFTVGWRRKDRLCRSGSQSRQFTSKSPISYHQPRPESRFCIFGPNT